MTVEEKVSIVLRDVLGIKPYEVSPTMRLREDLGLTESNALSLYAGLKTVFPSFTMTARDAERLITVQDAINFLKSKVGEDK